MTRPLRPVECRMGWEITSIIITLIMTVAAFLWKAFFTSDRADTTDRRDSDIEWKTSIIERLSHLEGNHKSIDQRFGAIESIISRFKTDVKDDIDDIREDLKEVLRAVRIT